jgi:hypothetical protein
LEGGATFRVDDRFRASWSLLIRGQLARWRHL